MHINVQAHGVWVRDGAKSITIVFKVFTGSDIVHPNWKSVSCSDSLGDRIAKKLVSPNSLSNDPSDEVLVVRDFAIWSRTKVAGLAR